MISIDITTNGAEITIPAGLEKLLSKENFRKFNEVGGRAAQQAAKKYHKEYNDAHLWRGPKYLGSGAGRAGEFGDEVTNAWTFEGSDDGATISNDASFYRVYGGVIKPKRAKNLSIPVVADAVGRRAKDYKGDLFFIKTKKGTKGLFEKDGDGVRMVYLLKDKVDQKPWLFALPPTPALAQAFGEGWSGAAIEELEKILA
jgi:hypothetical protein